MVRKKFEINLPEIIEITLILNTIVGENVDINFPETVENAL